MTAFVLDASVALSWCFGDEITAATSRLLDRLTDARAFVPTVWPLEVTNGLIVARRRQRLSEAQAAEKFALLGALPIDVDPETSSRAFHDIAALAVAHRLSAYDAAYLELAQRAGLPLATLDDPLRSAARAAGVADALADFA